MPRSTRAETKPSSSAESEARDIVVFWLVSDSRCSECGEELGSGRFLRMLDEKPLCLACADLDRLVFLASGDAAITRRACTYSTLRAVVVRFSRARHRYERQGTLVEEAALDRAERECLADAEARTRARARAASRRSELDLQFVEAFATRIAELFPCCPVTESRTIAEHACLARSGRIGRSAAGKELDPTAVELAVRAHVRHVHTAYDRLLADGRGREEARAEVCSAVDSVVEGWRRELQPKQP